MTSNTAAADENSLPRLVYSIREACQISTLGRATLNEHIRKGHLRVVRVGGRTLVPVESLHELITNGSEK